jgi:hypothetical protein
VTFTYDIATDRGRVRLLIPDTNCESYVFEDDEIDAFISLETDVRRSAAMALETIASSQAMTLKVIRLLDLQTDGASVAKSLMLRASALRKQAEDAEAMEADGGFEVIEMVTNEFGFRSRVNSEYLRS